jgi:hypothetical protein
MARRRLTAALLLAAGSWAGSALYRRRSAVRRRVDLYYGDGSIVSLPDGSPDAGPLLDLAREILHA